MKTHNLPLMQNEQIYLRRFIQDDAAFMHNLMNQKAWLGQIGDRNIASIQDAKRYLQQGPIKDYQQHGFGLYLIADRNSDIPLGTCGLLKRSYLSAPDIGFAISQPHAKKGYGFMASLMVLKHAKQQCNINELFATTKQSNQASKGLLTKLGFAQLQLLKVADEDLPLALFHRVL